MNKLFSHRVLDYDYKNNFLDLYKTNVKNDLKILDFGIGEDTSLIKEEDVNKLIEYINSSKSVFGYSENIFYGLYEAFQLYAYKHYGIYLCLENLLIAGGIKESLNRLAYLLVNKNDLVLVTNPGYSVFMRACKYYGAKIISLPLTIENNYIPNIVKYCTDLKLKPKIIQINYPNNPTSRSVSYSYYSELVNFVRSYGGIVINDAAYIDYTYIHPPISLLSQGVANLIELYSASKSFGITGCRVSMIAGDKRIIKELGNIRDQFDSGPSKTSLFFYKYFLEKDGIEDNKNKYLLRYHLLAKVLTKQGFKLNPIDSTFFIYAKINCKHSAKEEAKRWRKEKSIIVIPYDEDEKYFRFSLTYKDDKDIDLLSSRLI